MVGSGGGRASKSGRGRGVMNSKAPPLEKDKGSEDGRKEMFRKGRRGERRWSAVLRSLAGHKRRLQRKDVIGLSGGKSDRQLNKGG